MSTTLQPVTQITRNYFLDVWRGFAITGVLIVYILWDFGLQPREKWLVADQFIVRLINIMIDGKFYTALSLLFGIGFYLQLEKSRQNHKSVVPFALRRILLLMMLGAIHALFLRRSEVLMPYALCSLYLLLMRNVGNKTLIALMIFCFLTNPLYPEVLKWIGNKPPSLPMDSGVYLRDMHQTFVVVHNPVKFFGDSLRHILYFLIGFYAARNYWLKSLSSHPNKILMVFVFGGILGIGMFFIRDSMWPWFFRFPEMEFPGRLLAKYTWSVIEFIHNVSLAIAYMAGLYWLYLRSYKMKALANIGRMALTNYLLQSLIMIPACFIFGLFENVTPVKVVVWSAGIWISQAIFSAWWLRRYNFGPFEWLLRSFTYWKWQPMKKKESTKTMEIAIAGN